MGQKINLEEILNKHLASKTSLESDYDDVVFIKRAMKEACCQILELAAENAKMNLLIDEENDIVEEANIDKQSILNTINQIE